MYLNDTVRRPGRLEAAVAAPFSLTQMYQNIKEVAGVGEESEIVTEAPIVAREIESTAAGLFDNVKDFEAQPGPLETVAEFALVHLDVNDPSSIENDAILGIEQHLEGSSGSAQHLSTILFSRLGELSGFLQLFSILSGARSAQLCIGPDGYIGINLPEGAVPVYPLDVPSGSINASLGFTRNGSPIPDWAVVGGAATYAGNATVSGYLESTVATGTPPLEVTSTTTCPNLDTDFVQGASWDRGIQSSGSATYTAAETNIATLTLSGLPGTYEVSASVWIGCDQADNGLPVSARLRDGAGTQIGVTATQTAIESGSGGLDLYTAISLRLAGSYVAVTGSETIRVTVAVPTGTGNLAEAVIIAHRVRP